MNVTTSDLKQLVETALRNYENYAPPAEDAESASLAIPDPLGYALGWIVADAIVQDRYLRAALDALPICHPENGWDRIVITRRVTCLLCQEEPADWFGTLMLTGEDAPIYISPEGKELPLGTLLRQDPEAAVARVLELCTLSDLPEGDHANCWHARAVRYPDLYHAVTRIIAEHPGVTALREMYVDEEQIDGAFHPIYLMTGALSKGLEYGWFAIENADYTAFFRVTGEQSVYFTDNGTWSTVGKQLTEEDNEGIRRRLLSWLRIEGKPDRATLD
ncbi:MAG TPA: hypothetical protein VFU72_02425 [Nitrolancea sp.]|nr:hypothetical protein [Nitrolancea sp.]